MFAEIQRVRITDSYWHVSNMKCIDMVDWFLSTGCSFSQTKSRLTGKRILIYHVVVFHWISKNVRNPSLDCCCLSRFSPVVVYIILSRLFVYVWGTLNIHVEFLPFWKLLFCFINAFPSTFLRLSTNRNPEKSEALFKLYAG